MGRNLVRFYIAARKCPGLKRVVVDVVRSPPWLPSLEDSREHAPAESHNR
jgi:hypothetical protein